MIEMYEKPEICTACGGKCCQLLPGCAFPKDFGLPDCPSKTQDMTGLEIFLKSGRWAIDWWDGDPRKSGKLDCACFVRPAIKGKEGELLDPSFCGGPCTFLTSMGCELAPDHRPRGCQMLEPTSKCSGSHCIYHGGKYPKRDAAIAWLPYHDYFEQQKDLTDRIRRIK